MNKLLSDNDIYSHCPEGGGTPLFRLYGEVPLDRVWFFGLAVQIGYTIWLASVLNGLKTCLNKVWYYEPRDFNSDCEESLSFLSLWHGACEKLKEHGIERRTSDAFLSWFASCQLSKATVNRTLQCNQSISDHFLDKNAIVVGILM